MATITLKGREIPLMYTVYEMKSVQEEIAPLGEIQYVITGRNRDDDEDTSKYASPDHLKAVAKLLQILGNAGLEEAGEEPNLTERWIMRALRPGEIVNAVNACMKAMNEGMATETTAAKQKSSGPVDVVLEEIEEKKEPAS